jgi:hypothetical protein
MNVSRASLRTEWEERMFHLSRVTIVALPLVVVSTLSFAASGHRSPDFADSLSGGPDYWEVTGVGAGDTLSVRKEPSLRAARIAQFPNGTVLRNLGCKIARSQRWCRVEQPSGSSWRGWVNGHYLRETGEPK